MARDGYTSMAAGIWFWMTPQSPKPSMHDVMTGFMEPTETDTANNFGADFGTTINIINGGYECGRESTKAASRAEYYTEWLNVFGMTPNENLSCANQAPSFPYNGYGDQALYFEKHWEGTECRVVKWQTQYSLLARDDYKRCICDSFGSGAADCPTVSGSDDDDQIPDEDEDDDEGDCPEPYIPDGDYTPW